MRRLLSGLAILMLGAAPALAHEPVLLHASRATPGLRLEIVEARPAAPLDSGRAGYKLRAIGLPRGVVFDVWAKEFGHAFHEIASGFRVADSGEVVSEERGTDGRPRRLEDLTFDPGPNPRGAIWEVAVVSADRTLSAFAKVIPRPITAHDGNCSLSLELVSHRGERFVAAGTGFAPGADVVTELRYAGRVIEKIQRVAADGRLAPIVLSHGSTGSDRHARYAVKGRSCEVAVEYDWGAAAFDRR